MASVQMLAAFKLKDLTDAQVRPRKLGNAFNRAHARYHCSVIVTRAVLGVRSCCVHDAEYRSVDD